MQTPLQRQKQRPRKRPPLTSKHFTKNDAGFVCAHCGALVPPLLTSSRDHCTQCLHSLHVDINPGDRANPCRGKLVPIGITQSNKKGTVIKYHCDTCGAYHNCKAAPDDNYDTILRVAANPVTYLYTPPNPRS